jgi:spermidine/putrescine transport system ATP-binding protein
LFSLAVIKDFRSEDGSLSEPSSYAVELIDVSKIYGSFVALDNVSLQIRRGEFYTLLGPSGCGKTTTLNIVGGFIPISQGQVLINGRPVQNDPPYRRNVNTVFQNYALFPHMTVAQNIGFGLKMKKVAQAEIDRRAAEMLSLISLEEFGQRYPGQLSGGQQQRVALARALVNHPEVLLLDEPLGALDLKIRKQLQVELLNIQRKVGITFVYVTHDQEEAMALSDRIAVMSKGKVAQEGTPAEIYYHPANRFVADFIGESNFFRGVVVEAKDGQAAINVPGFARPVCIPLTQAVSAGQKVSVMVRPERMTWSAQTTSDIALDNLTEAVVRKVAFLGMYTQLVGELADGSLILIHQTGEVGANNTSPDLVGQQVLIGWQKQDGQILAD